jgi:uncharacterized membrane protein
MRIVAVVGVLLVALGIYIMAGAATYRSKREVLRIGELKASVDEEHVLPRWTGILAVAIGGVMLVSATRRRP